VSYGDPVILHESSQKRVAFIPFFVPHSDHTEMAAKIVTYRRQAAPLDWAVVEERSVSLSEAAARRLVTALRMHLTVAEGNEDGEFIVVRIEEGTAQLGGHDPAKIAAALTRVLGQREIVAHLRDAELSGEIAVAFRSAIKLREMQGAVQELRTRLEAGENSEATYQDWCERHSWAFGSAYVLRDEVRSISTGDRLDLLLPNVIAGYRDLVELKRPDRDVLLWDERHGNFYFSADVSRAIGQCHRYLDVLHEEAASGLRDHPEIVAYHPRATIVIGRSAEWPEEKHRALHGLNRRLAGVNVMTYDHLLAQGERLLSILSTPAESVGIDDASTEWDDEAF
jgi:hypothetical protein